MDHLPSNYSPFRQQLEGSWFRSHLNSSAWHTSFKCAVVCVDAHRSVCSLWVKTSQNCTSTLTVNTHRSVCPLHVGQDGTELHVDAHGQHSQKCVSTVGQDGTEFDVDAHGQHSQKCVSTVGQDGMHMAGSTQGIWEASQTVSDHWGFQTELTTSKWSTRCLMYMDFGSTLQCASTLVGPYWFHVPS